MAGVTDRPFRALCKRLGAGLATSEMVSARPELRQSRKTRLRLDHQGEFAPIAVQIAGADPVMLAEATRFNIDQGAQLIDINMGCPAKKVCNVSAGSALLKDEPLVGKLLAAVVTAANTGQESVPVTLKIRTGWDREHRNGVRIAKLAEASGVRALAVHGRTRACGFKGAVEYDTIAEIKSAVSIPVIANGDIDGPESAHRVLAYTGADAVMIGRAAQGRPWIFRQINHYLTTGRRLADPPITQIRVWLLGHLLNLYEFYGEQQGVRIARKHLRWYTRGRPEGQAFWQQVNRVDSASRQYALTESYFDQSLNTDRS